MNIYQQQAENQRWTVIIVIAYFCFFLFIGLGFDISNGMPFPVINPPGSAGAFAYESSGQSLPLGTIISLIVALIMVITAFSAGPSMILNSSGAREANPDLPQEKVFLNVLEEMSISAGIPPPKGYVIPDPDPNAFATGLSTEAACIAVTEGLLAKLNREELQGVVAHEMAHVRNQDMRLMTLIAALGGAIVLISDWLMRSSRSSSRRSSKGGGNAIFFIIWLVMVILAPIITKMLAMAISRRREYLADATGAELTRNPLALASALEKIRAAVEPTHSIKNGVAHMCIADPTGSALEESESSISDLFATHPPIQKRILALKLMAYNKPVNA